MEAKSPQIVASLSLGLERLGRLAEAHTAIDLLLIAAPERSGLFLLKGKILRRVAFQAHSQAMHRSLLEDACSAYEKVIEINPQSTNGWNEKGRMHMFLFQLDQAIAAFNQVLQLNPKRESAVVNKAWMLTHLNRACEALAVCDSAIAIGLRTPGVLGEKGWALLHLSRFNDALEAYTEAKRACSELQIKPLAKIFIGEIAALKETSPLSAIEACKNALSAYPTDHMFWHSLAVAKANAGYIDSAVDAMGQAIYFGIHPSCLSVPALISCGVSTETARCLASKASEKISAGG